MGAARTGSGEFGRMTCGPAPGMLKPITTLEGQTEALASVSISRKEPAPVSFVLRTVRLTATPTLSACRQGENSEVAPLGSVAVAERNRPKTATGNVTLKLAWPWLSVAAPLTPRNCWPSPWPAGSQTELAKNSTW